jgi:hypothetical protein
MLFSNRNKCRKNGSATANLLSGFGHLERQAAEICFRRNVIITHVERGGFVDTLALTYLAQYGVGALGKDRAAEIARNLELSGTCRGLADCILSQ